MFTVRLIGGLIAIAGASIIAFFTDVGFINVVAMMAFVLTVDQLILKWIAHVYMKAVLASQSKHERTVVEMEKRNGDDSSSN